MVTNRQLLSQKSSIVDDRLGSKYASVKVTLHLTFLEKHSLWKVDEIL